MGGRKFLENFTRQEKAKKWRQKSFEKKGMNLAQKSIAEAIEFDQS